MSHIEYKNLPKVAIIGRPNVGKSSLFNRMIGHRKAIVEATAGITRDRLHAYINLMGNEFVLVDTGGIVADSKIKMEQLIYKQSAEAIDEADCLIFVCDVRSGIAYQDEHIASIIQRSNKKVFVAINKVDSESSSADIYEFCKLGLGEPFAVSALHGTGFDLLYDQLIPYVNQVSKGRKKTDLDTGEIEAGVKIAIVGRPNVGKSSFVNCILDEERLIVDEVPGTTRDSIDVSIRREKGLITLIDTAGMRHKKTFKESIEVFSLARTKQSIKRSDVSIVMIDGTTSMMREDIAVLAYVIKERKPCILAVNKHDLIKEKDIVESKKELRRRLKFLEWIPIVFTSAKEKKNIIRAVDMALATAQKSAIAIQTSELNKVMQKIHKAKLHPIVGTKRPKIFYATQVRTNPPAFVIFCSEPRLVRQDYLRYIENNFRKEFDLMGVPITFELKGKSEPRHQGAGAPPVPRQRGTSRVQRRGIDS